MARIEDIERRLLNWARWREGSGYGGLGYTSVNLVDGNTGRDTYAQAKVPTDDVEASETDLGVQALQPQLNAAVVAVYTEAGGIKAIAQRLHCAESTVYARIDQAHYQLASWLSGRALAARTQRERVEALQQAARIGSKRSFTE